MMIFDFEKRYIERTLNKSNLRNHSIINIHRLNTQNSGDLQCAPYLYFKKLQNFEKIDIVNYLSCDIFKTIRWVKQVVNNDIVLGGGGLFDRPSFEHSIDMMILLLRKGRKIVPWGVGHNNPSFQAGKTFYERIKYFKLLGLRDYGIKGTEWVPCVSCMNKIFDNCYEKKSEIGIIEHENITIADGIRDKFPCISNSSSFNRIIEFIGSIDTLITNSYHAMYWALLMKRKVIVIPNSSKMFSFKYKVPVCYNVRDYKKHLKSAQIYDGLLEECRDINMKFSVKVFDYLNLK